MKSFPVKTAPAIFIISLLSWGVFLPLARVYAESDLKSALKEVAGKVEEISELKKNESLSAEEKEKKELQVRKETLEKIFDLTLLEDQDLKDRLTAPQNLSDNQKKSQDVLLGQLAENENAYKEMRGRLETIETIKEVKQSAADFKNWRNTVYNPKVEKILSFTLAFQQKNTLETANNRLVKIKSDLKKLEDAKIIKKEDTSALLKKAGANLNSAGALNKEAENLAADILMKEFFPNKPKAVLADPEEAQLNLSEVKELIEDSLNQIKTAYRIFIEIGKLVRERNSK